MFPFTQEWISDWNVVSVLIRLLIAWIIGFIIGMDRERKNRSAGIRTHILVCVGTALATMTSTFVLFSLPDASMDVTRLGGHVIAGIGFLGAGSIFMATRNRIEGLTTAAGLWACCCCGIAIGFGFVEGTVIAVILIVITQILLPVFEKTVRPHNRLFDLYVEFKQGQALGSFLRLLHTENLSVSDFHIIQEDTGTEGTIAAMTIKMDKQANKDAFLDQVRLLDSVEFITVNYPR